MDLIIETGTKILLVELKYQPKFRVEYDQPLLEFSETMSRKRPIEKMIVYTGERELRLESGTRVLPYSQFLQEMQSRTDLD